MSATIATDFDTAAAHGLDRVKARIKLGRSGAVR